MQNIVYKLMGIPIFHADSAMSLPASKDLLIVGLAFNKKVNPSKKSKSYLLH